MSHFAEWIEKCSAEAKINKIARSRAKKGPPPPVSSTRPGRNTGGAASESSVDTDIKRSSISMCGSEPLEMNAVKLEDSAELQGARETMQRSSKYVIAKDEKPEESK